MVSAHVLYLPRPYDDLNKAEALIRLTQAWRLPLSRSVRPFPAATMTNDDTGLDAALIHSTIDAIPSPNGLLGRMGGARGIVRENGGVVVVVSAYEWNEDVTPEGAWLGGYLDKDGNEVRSYREEGVLHVRHAYLLVEAKQPREDNTKL